jgi:hypothetical protein
LPEYLQISDYQINDNDNFEDILAIINTHYQLSIINYQLFKMSLKTRENPDTGALEVLVNDEWVKFEEYRKRQIDVAYKNSIKFLRDRLGEDAANELATKSDEANDETKG